MLNNEINSYTVDHPHGLPDTKYSKHRYIDDEQFAKIEEYLEHHPLSNALQISTAINISTNEILRYINEGKLVMVDGKVGVSEKNKR